MISYLVCEKWKSRILLETIKVFQDENVARDYYANLKPSYERTHWGPWQKSLFMVGPNVPPLEIEKFKPPYGWDGKTF